MSDYSLYLLRGTLDLLILRALHQSSVHGYGISAWLRRRTNDALVVQEAALYQALRRLERKDWVDAEWGVSENSRRARYYGLTAHGRRQLEKETASWSRYAEAVFKVLDPAAGDALCQSSTSRGVFVGGVGARKTSPAMPTTRSLSTSKLAPQS